VNDDLNEQLRAADPVAREGGLSLTEVEAMRRTIVLAPAVHGPHTGLWPWRLSLATALAVMLVLGLWIGRQFERASEQTTQPQANEQRQLQFETPGGTRVVWVLNSKLDLPKDRQP
jgi:hypothetical protein